MERAVLSFLDKILIKFCTFSFNFHGGDYPSFTHLRLACKSTEMYVCQLVVSDNVLGLTVIANDSTRGTKNLKKIK